MTPSPASRTDQPSPIGTLIGVLALRQGWPGKGHSHFAAAVGVVPRTVRAWASGHATMPDDAMALLRAMLRDPPLAALLLDRYEPGSFPMRPTLDRLLYAIGRDPSLAGDLRQSPL